MTVKISYKQTSGIGRIICFHRKQSGLSRVDPADIAGVGKTVIFDIEHGKESVRLNLLYFRIIPVMCIFLTLRDHKIFHRGHKVFSVSFVHSLSPLRLKQHMAAIIFISI